MAKEDKGVPLAIPPACHLVHAIHALTLILATVGLLKAA
jgi:hypothetical protein